MSVQSVIARNKRYVQLLNKAIARELGEAGSKMTKQARSVHRFRRKSGNLQRSIQHRVVSRDTLVFGINPDMLTVENGYNYGVIQHDGRGSGYKKSPISPDYGTKNTGDLDHDHFVWNAWADGMKTLKTALRELPTKIKRLL